MNQATLTKNGNVLVLERIINASKERVWEAHTVSEVFSQWWGPEGWKTTVVHFDFARGGYLFYGMTCEDQNQGEWFGKTSWGKMVYEAIAPDEGFTYIDYFCDENGKVIEGMPAPRITLSFDALDDKTKLTSVATYDSEDALQQVLEMGMEEGIKQSLDRLERVLQ